VTSSRSGQLPCCDAAERSRMCIGLATTGADWFTGRVDEVARRIRELEAAGVWRVYLRHVLYDDLEMVRLAGGELIPRVG
jgi:hypothetical protein